MKEYRAKSKEERRKKEQRLFRESGGSIEQCVRKSIIQIMFFRGCDYLLLSKEGGSALVLKGWFAEGGGDLPKISDTVTNVVSDGEESPCGIQEFFMSWKGEAGAGQCQWSRQRYGFNRQYFPVFIGIGNGHFHHMGGPFLHTRACCLPAKFRVVGLPLLMYGDGMF